MPANAEECKENTSSIFQNIQFSINIDNKKIFQLNKPLEIFIRCDIKVFILHGKFSYLHDARSSNCYCTYFLINLTTGSFENENITF